MEDLNIYQDERPWGNFRQFTHNLPSTVKIITVSPNESLSLQSHEKRSEFWHVIRGDGIVEIDDLQYNAEEGGEYNIPVKSKHQIRAGSSGIAVLEISLGDFDENDILRFEDQYGRA